MTGGYDYFYTLQEICVLLNLLPNTFRQIAREYSDVIILREQIRKGRPVMGLPRPDFEALRQIVAMRSHGVSGDEIRRVVGLASARAPVIAAERCGSLAREDTTATDDPLEAGGDETIAVPGEVATVEETPSAAGDEEMIAATGDEETISAGPPARDPRLYGTPRSDTEASLSEEMVRDGGEAVLAEEAAASGESVGERVGGSGDEPPAAKATFLDQIGALREELQTMDGHRREERDKLLTALMRTQHELQSLRYEVGVSLSRRDRKRKRGFWAWLLDL